MTVPRSNPITTTGLTTTVSTTHASGETMPEWVERHDEAVGASTPSGNTLTTTYTSANGPETVVTTRKEGESDSEFLTRHRLDCVIQMLNTPPIP